MSPHEQRVREAFDEILLPPQVRKRTLEAIASARSKPNVEAKNTPKAKLSARRVYGRRIIGSLAACLALVALCFSGAKLYFDETAYVGIDINPSIELGINRFDIVVSTKALNDDGYRLLDTTSITGKTYDKAVAQLTESAAFGPYLQEDAYMEISVTASNDRQAEALRTQSSACIEALPCRGSSNRVSEDARDAATSAGMGVGRYRAALELIALDTALSLEDCSAMSMKELRNRIKEASGIDRQDSSCAQSSQEQGETGQGCGGQSAAGSGSQGEGAETSGNDQAGSSQSEEAPQGKGERHQRNGQVGNGGAGRKSGE